MVMFLQKVDNIRNKSVSSYQNFAAEVKKLGAGDEIRQFDGTFFKHFYKYEKNENIFQKGQYFLFLKSKKKVLFCI